MDTCSDCGADTSAVSHRCDVCGRRNHAICGVTIGEGYGGFTRCFTCDLKPDLKPTPTKKARDRLSASPIITAFARTTERAEAETKEACTEALAAVPAAPSANSIVRKRSKQHVTTVADRIRVVKRMRELEAAGVKHVKAAVVHEFKDVFSGESGNDLESARVWWGQRDLLDPENPKLAPRQSISVKVDGGIKRVDLKVIGSTRGRHRSDWVVWIYPLIMDEFLRLRAMGIKMSYPILQDIARFELANSQSEWKDDTVVDGVALGKKITTRWIQRFCECHNIVFRSVSGKLMVSEAKQTSIDRAIAYHLGQLKREFDGGDLDEDTVFNMDETHFVINVDDGRTLDVRGATKVKYHDVVSGGEGMTMVVKLRGGSGARVETPMMIFMNANSSYPIRGLKDEVGVVYRSGPKGWMNRRIFCEWLKEDKCVRRDPRDRNQVIFMDNVAGHHAIPNITDPEERSNMESMLNTKRVALRFLPPNSTHMCQPADAMIIQKLKQVWKMEWEKEKMALARQGRFSDKPNKKGEWSGMLCHPGKKFYLKLAAKCCRAVSEMRDENGVNLVRKAMIRCGLGKNLNGKWEETQLLPELQHIIKTYRENFDGKEPEAAA